MRCYFPIGILGQVWYLLVLIPDLCPLSYFLTIGKDNNEFPAHVYRETLGLLRIAFNITMILRLCQNLGFLLIHQWVLTKISSQHIRGCEVHSVTCLAKDACLTADQRVASWILARSHTFVEIDHETIYMVLLLPPLIHSRKGCYKRKYVHVLLVNRLFKPAQVKVWLGELTILP